MATTITDRLGVAPGSPAYGNDLSAIEALNGTGVLERTGAEAWTLRALADYQNSAMQWGGTDTGVANAYVFALSPVLAAYVAGGVYGGKVATGHSNTGACTADFGPGAKSIKMPDGSDPPAGALAAGQSYRFLYDGTNLIVLNPSAGGIWRGNSTAEVTVASASTCDVLGAASLLVAVSGTTTITSLGTGANRVRFVRFEDVLTLVHDDVSLILPADGADITTAAGDCMIVESDASSNVRVLVYQRADGTAVVATSAATILGQNKGHIFGLTLSNNSSDSTNDIDIAAGEAVDATNTYLIKLASGVTKRLDASWAAGTGNGGRDTGSIANGTWHVFLIGKSTDASAADVLFSTSATAPTMPNGWDIKRRIGSILRESAAIVAFRQIGDEFRRASVWDRNSTALLSSSLLTVSVPTGIVIRPVLSLDLKLSGVVEVANSLGDAAAGSANVVVQSEINTASGGSGRDTVVVDEFFTNTSAQIYMSVAGSGGTPSINTLTTIGWIDTRGKDA